MLLGMNVSRIAPVAGSVVARSKSKTPSNTPDVRDEGVQHLPLQLTRQRIRRRAVADRRSQRGAKHLDALRVKPGDHLAHRLLHRSTSVLAAGEKSLMPSNQITLETPESDNTSPARGAASAEGPPAKRLVRRIGRRSCHTIAADARIHHRHGVAVSRVQTT